MARVEEDARKAQDAERLQQKIDREARDAKTGNANRESFAKLVKGNQQQATTAKAKTDAKTSQQQQGAKVAKEQQAQNQKTKTSRSSVQTQSKAMEQARSFQGVLAKQETSTKQTDTARVESRDDGNKNDRVERDDREVDLKRADTKRDVEQETARVEARELGRPNAAIDSRGGGDASGGDGRGDDRGAANALSAMKAATVQQAQQASSVHQVKQIPPEMLEKLVSAVYLGVNDKGLKEFQIELKDGPLKGAAMRISADDGKVSLSFNGLDADTKRLVEASKGELMRRLSAKGLTLSRLDVK